MKIVLNTLPRGRSEQFFESVAQLQQDDSIEWKVTGLEVKVDLDRQDQSLYLHGHVKCSGLFICEAGMEEFEDSLRGEFELILTSNPRHLEDNDSDDIILLQANQVEFDLYPYVHDTILLAIPISHVCGPDCKAGQKLRDSIKSDDAPDERWAKLKDMFNE